MSPNLWLLPLTLGTASLPFVFGIARNLEYEYATLTAWIQLVAFPIAALFYPLSFLVQNPVNKVPWYKASLWIVVLGPAITLAPGLYAFLFRLARCQPQEFLFWMGLQWFPSWLLANALFFGIWRLRTRYLKRRKIALGLATVYAGLLAHAAATLWLTPQKRITHLLLGFLHGPVYDTWIPVDTGIALARTSHLFAGALLLLAVFWRRTGTTWIWTMLFTASWLGTSFAASQFDSVGAGISALNEKLPYELKHPNFTLHYASANQESGEPPVYVQRIYNDAAFHVAELDKLFAGRGSKHVDIYLYPDQTSKKLWFGGGATDVADVVTPSVHITAGEWPHGTLRHELVHALAAEFGYHGLGFHPNMAFTEGLAMALAPVESNLSYDESVAALANAKRLPPVGDIFSPLFWREASNRAYVVAGSLLNYLIETRGIKAVAELYAGDSWQKVFGAESKDVLDMWQKHAQQKFDAERYALYTEAAFRDPGVWRGMCVHSKATLRQPRSQSLFTRLRQPPGWAPDSDYWEWRLQLAPRDQAAKLNLHRLDASKFSAKNPSKVDLKRAIADIEQDLRWPPESLEDVELAILMSDLNMLLGDQAASEKLLHEVLDFAAKNNIGSDLLRQAEARLYVHTLGEPGFVTAWTRYLGGWRTKPPLALSEPEPWLLQYLRLRRGEASVIDRKVLSDYARNLPTESLSNTFAVEWYKFLGHRFMEVGLHSAAADAYKAATDIAEPGRKAWLAEQQRRALFYRDSN